MDKKLLILLDTEFTDFINCDLISIGMACDDGKHEFYAERSDYERTWCNPAVQTGILPLLDGSNVVTRSELATQLRTWLSSLPSKKVAIGGDSRTDWDLLMDILDGELPANITNQYFDLRHMTEIPVFQNAIRNYHDQPNQPWHHALHDAKAHRAGWLAWIAASNKAKNEHA